MGKSWQRTNLSHGFLLVVYFLILSLFLTRPLWTVLTTHSVGGYGDNVYFIWQIEWIKQALFDLKSAPYKTDLLNYPYGYNLASTEIAPLQILFALPFAMLGNPVLGYNVSILLTFFLSGLTMYYWVFQMTHSRGASLIAATAYSALPYHAAHFLSGHLNLSAVQWFPLYWLGFTNILSQERFRGRDMLLLVGGFACIALTSQYYLFMTLMVSFWIAVIYLGFYHRGQIRNRKFWKGVITAGLLCLPFMGVSFLPAYLLYGGSDRARSIADVMVYSASITDFLLPFSKNIVWGEWVWRIFPRDLWTESTLYLGIPVTLLAITGFRQNKEWGQSDRSRVFRIGIWTSVILAMGTNLTWMEEPLIIKMPDGLGGLVNNEETIIPLPGYLLFRYFPFYSFMRAWMRYGVFALVFNCAAAGLGAAWLLKKVQGKWRLLITITLTSLILLDFTNTPFKVEKMEARPVDSWLAEQPRGAQVQLPLYQSFETRHIYYTLYNRKPTVGNHPVFPSDRFFEMDPVLKSFPSDESVSALRELDVTYVILDEAHYSIGRDLIEICKSKGLELVYRDGEQAVFLIE